MLSMAKVDHDTSLVIVGPWGSQIAEMERLEQERTSAVRSLRGAIVPGFLGLVFWWHFIQYMVSCTAT